MDQADPKALPPGSLLLEYCLPIPPSVLSRTENTRNYFKYLLQLLQGDEIAKDGLSSFLLRAFCYTAACSSKMATYGTLSVSEKYSGSL